MTQDELKMVLEALEESKTNNDSMEFHDRKNKAITAIKEALAKEKALQALHNENERLGLYKDAYAQTQEPVEKFCDSNCIWTDHHPDCKLAQPEQEPVVGTKTWFEDGKVVTQHLTAKDIYKEPEQEPVIDKSAATRIATSLGWSPQRTKQDPDDIASILACRDMLDAQPKPVQFKCTVIDDAHPDGVSLEKWTSPPQRIHALMQNIRNYLAAAADGNMSRNNSEQLASELLQEIDAHGIKENT